MMLMVVTSAQKLAMPTSFHGRSIHATSRAKEHQSMSSGWIKLYRKIEENPALEEHDALGVFCRLLVRASRDDRVVFVHKARKNVALKRGQLWVSLRDMATRKCKYQQIRTIFKRLESAHIINAVTNAGITIVTICNYDEYQADERVNNAEDNTSLTQGQREDGAQEQEDKKERSREEESSLRSDSPSVSLPDEAFKIWIDELGDVLPTPRKLEGDRKSKLIALLKKRMGNDLAQWRDYCRMVRSNPWNLGDNPTGWRASIDYMLKDIKARDILEKGHRGENGVNGHGKSSSRGRRNGSALDDLKQVAIGDTSTSGESGGGALVLDETHERSGGKPQGNLLRLDQSSDGPPDWFDREGGEFSDRPRNVVAGDRGF